MSYAQTTVKGSTTTSKIKPGEVESISIQRADNGWTVSTNTKQKPTKRNQPVDWEAGRDSKIFNSLDDLLAHVRLACGGKAAGGSATEEKTEGEAA